MGEGGEGGAGGGDDRYLETVRREEEEEEKGEVVEAVEAVVVEAVAAARDVRVCGGGWLGGHAETELDGSSDLRKADGGPSTLAEVTRATMMV